MAGLRWPLPDGLGDEALERAFCFRRLRPRRRRGLVAAGLGGPPDRFDYSWFCGQYVKSRLHPSCTTQMQPFAMSEAAIGRSFTTGAFDSLATPRRFSFFPFFSFDAFRRAKFWTPIDTFEPWRWITPVSRSIQGLRRRSTPGRNVRGDLKSLGNRAERVACQITNHARPSFVIDSYLAIQVSITQSSGEDSERTASSRKREDGRKALLVYLPPDLIKDLKRAALDDDRRVYEILEEASRQWLERRSEKARAK
jgi:hypothetical protein